MERTDSARIRANPRYRIGAGFQTDLLRTQIGTVVVCREAPDPQIVQKLSHLLGLTLGPFEIGRIEFDALKSHLRDGAHGGLRVFFQFIADRIKFEAERNRFCGANRNGPRQHRRKSEKRTSRKNVYRHSCIVLKNERNFIPFCKHASCFGMLSTPRKARRSERMHFFDVKFSGIAMLQKFLAHRRRTLIRPGWWPAYRARE